MIQSFLHERWQAAKARIARGLAWDADEDENDKEAPDDGSLIINGVELPAVVVWELRRLGMSLSSYTAGELQSAVQACMFDKHLIDDPDGINFMDELTLTTDEKYYHDHRYDRDSDEDDEDSPHIQSAFMHCFGFKAHAHKQHTANDTFLHMSA